MRAVVIGEASNAPAIRDWPRPEPRPGASLIRVSAGGVGASDTQRAAGVFGTIVGDYVVGGEGVGHTESGARVYFGHSVSPFGSWADWTLVPDEEVWPIPASVDAGLAIALGISGTGALIPLEEAQISPGEQVLVLGATGPVGQVGLQYARLLGARRVVAAARDPAALQRLRDRGLADEVVHLGLGNDLDALKAAAGGGYDVVLDVVYGAPAEAAMRSTAPGARMMSIGVQAGPTMTLSLRDLVTRSHSGVGTGQRPVAERKAAFYKLIDLAVRGAVEVDSRAFPLEQALQAWNAQTGSPHAKIYLTLTPDG